MRKDTLYNEVIKKISTHQQATFSATGSAASSIRTMLSELGLVLPALCVFCVLVVLRTISGGESDAQTGDVGPSGWCVSRMCKHSPTTDE